MAKKGSSNSLPAKVGMGMGGLGDFTEESLGEIIDDSGTHGTATSEDIRDAMGNARPRLEMVKVKGHGANLFQRDDEVQIPGKEGLKGIIVAFTRHNSWFNKPFGENEDGELPNCFSNDGTNIAPNAADPQSEGGCATCTRNRDARDRAARDAAYGRDQVGKCNNYISFALALPGEEVPVRLRLTQNGAKEWAQYVQQIGTKGRFQPHEVVTHITLENKERDGNEFSVAHFKCLGALKPEVREQFKKHREIYRAILQRDAERDEQEGGTGEGSEALKKEADAATQQDAGL